MATVTVKHGDTHSLDFQVVGTGIVSSLTGASGKVNVKPRYSTGAAQTFPVTLAGDVATWALDGTLPVGVYELEIELTVDGRVITAPSDGYVRLTVMEDLA